MATVTIILGYRASGSGDAPVPDADYADMEVAAVTTAEDSTLTATDDDQFWFVTCLDDDLRILQHTPGDTGTDVTSTTGWIIPAGARWEAKATVGKTISLIAV